MELRRNAGLWAPLHTQSEQTLEARAVDNANGQPLVFATFHANAVAGPAAALSITTQPSAAAQSGIPLSQQPAVHLVDKYSNPVSSQGLRVTASVPQESTRTLPGTASVTADASGVARSTDLAF